MADITTTNEGQEGLGVLLGSLLQNMINNQVEQCKAGCYQGLAQCLSNSATQHQPPPDGILASLSIENSSQFLDIQYSASQGVTGFIGQEFGGGGYDGGGYGGGGYFNYYAGE